MTATDDALRKETDRLIQRGNPAPHEFARHILNLQATVDAQSAELARLRGMGWQPIGEADMNGLPLWLGRAGNELVRVGYWHKAECCWCDFASHHPLDWAPTHCQPLPEPPAALASRNGGGGV